MQMEQSKKRKPQKNVTLRDAVYEQLHAYCEAHQLKHSEFVEIALHTFLHMHGSPKDICKNIVKEHCLQDKMMEDLIKIMRKSNRLQKKILAMSSECEEEESAEESTQPVAHLNKEGLLLKIKKGEVLTSLEAGYLIGHGICPKCGEQLKKGSFTNSSNGKTIAFIECPNWPSCCFQIRGTSGTPLEAIVGQKK